MGNPKFHVVVMSLLVAAVASMSVPSQAHPVNHSEVDRILRTWPAGPQLAAREMMEKYGIPHDVTDRRLIWRDVGAFKRIQVTREELPHDFPLPHKDYLEHMISYKVPLDKVDEVLAFDASLGIYRVGGELTARCDHESNNVLTLNLAHDIITGKRSVAEARRAFGDIVMERTLGKKPSYAMALQFRPHSPAAAAEPESPTIPGVAHRPAPGAPAPRRDAEIMARLGALDQSEVHAAMTAEMKRNLRPSIMNYAMKLHANHGRSVDATATLAVRLGVRPVLTPAVEALQAKHALALAAIVPLDGEAFTRAFLEMMIQGHTEAQQMLDRDIRLARNRHLRMHLVDAHKMVTDHLQDARRLLRERTGETTRMSRR
jgi:predicted outer membrane protein